MKGKRNESTNEISSQRFTTWDHPKDNFKEISLNKYPKSLVWKFFFGIQGRCVVLAADHIEHCFLDHFGSGNDWTTESYGI